MHGGGAGVDLALGVQVFVEMLARGAAVYYLHAADLDDAVAAFGLEARGFGVEYDLSQELLSIAPGILPQRYDGAGGALAMIHPLHLRLDILPPAQLALWPELRQIPAHFVLYGGTAIALRLGHRQSVDFDFFTFQDLAEP